MSGKIIPIILGKGQGFPGTGPPPTFWPFMVDFRTVMLMYCNKQIKRLKVYWKLSFLPFWNQLVLTRFFHELALTEEGNGNPLQYSCLGNPMERGRLQFTGSQRVGHDWATSLSLSLWLWHSFKGYSSSLLSCFNFSGVLSNGLDSHYLNIFASEFIFPWWCTQSKELWPRLLLVLFLGSGGEVLIHSLYLHQVTLT